MSLFRNPTFQFFAILALIVSAALIGYFTTKKEAMAPVDFSEEEKKVEEEVVATVQEEVQPQDDGNFAETTAPEQKGEIKPEDLLPKSEDIKQWEAQFPVGAGDVQDKNFLVAGHNIGINTVSSSLKNANLQLRSDPYIPRVETGPWNQSTIMSSDLTNRKVFEIGNSA